MSVTQQNLTGKAKPDQQAKPQLAGELFSPKVDCINGLRALAVLLVIFHHVVGVHKFQAGFATLNLGKLTLYPGTILSNGWIGVKLFFVLSGIVLFLPYARGQRAFVGPKDTLEFYKRRAIRLLPLYFLSVFVCLAIGPTATDSKSTLMWLVIMGSMAFGLSPRTFCPNTNWVLWSLATEFYFSLVFPFLAKFIQRFGIVKIWVVTMLFSLGIRYLGIVLGFGNDPSPYMDFVSSSVFGSLDDFVTGMFLAHLMVQKWEIKLKIPPIFLTLLGAILLSFSLMLCDAWVLHVLPLFMRPLIATCINLSLFVLVGSIALYPQQIVSKLVSNWPLQLIGMMCYSLYVWHGIVMKRMVPGPEAFSALNFVAYVVILFGLSWCTYRWVEFGTEKDWKKLLPKSLKKEKAVSLA